MAGNWSRAGELLREPLSHAYELRDKRLVHDNLALLAIIDLSHGELEQAERTWLKVAAHGRQHRDPFIELWSLLGQAETRLRGGHPVPPALLARADDLQIYGDWPEKIRLLAARAAAAWIDGHQESAVALATLALSQFRSNRRLAVHTVQACGQVAQVLVNAWSSEPSNRKLARLARDAARLVFRLARANRFLQARAALLRGDIARLEARTALSIWHWRRAAQLAQRFDQTVDRVAANQRLSPNR